MAKSNISTPSVEFAKGGTTKMFGQQYAVKQEAGVTSHQGNSNADWAQGGKGHMFGQGHANKAEEGKTAKGSQ
jgi:hypothetical protein